MKESFSELYTRLYQENFSELEALRSKAKNDRVMLIFAIIGTFILISISPLFIILAIIVLIIWSVNQSKASKVSPETRGKTYPEVFKEKVIGPIIENTFGGSKYNAKMGLEAHEYRKAGYKEYFDRYSSDDLIIAPLNVKDEVVTSIKFAEVHTQKESTDSDGNKRLVTVFHGLAGSFLISKSTGKNIYIRANGRVSKWNKNKVNMDMSEFEKVFDVESDDPILAMRILTADVMTDMIDLYQKYKYKFEINILDDTVYMRLKTGAMFEPNTFKSSMEYKTIERYYIVLKALTSIASKIYDTVLKLEI